MGPRGQNGAELPPSLESLGEHQRHRGTLIDVSRNLPTAIPMFDTPSNPQKTLLILSLGLKKEVDMRGV
jgi:hypothetical protein